MLRSAQLAWQINRRAPYGCSRYQQFDSFSRRVRACQRAGARRAVHLILSGGTCLLRRSSLRATLILKHLGPSGLLIPPHLLRKLYLTQFLIIFEVVTLILYAGYAVGLCRERSNFVWIHGLILALACISLVTNALLIVIFAAFNKTGHIETPIVYTQQALVNVQNTIARVLLLMLFKGYGLMNVTLPKIKVLLNPLYSFN